MPTITQPVRTKDTAGIRQRRVVSLTAPTSYVNPGGDTLLASDVGLGTIEVIHFPTTICDSAGANNRIANVVYAADNSSVTFRYFTALGTEVANAVDLSAYTFRIEVAGK